MGAGGVGAGGTSSTLSTLGTGAVGGRGSGGSGGPAASNFLGSFFSYPVVTALPSTDTGSTSRNSSSTNAVSSTVTHTVPAYGSTSYTTTNTASRTGTTRGTATIRGNTRGTTPSTATVEGFNGGTTGDVLTRMPFYATSLRFKVAPPAVERVRAIVQDVIRGSSTVPSKDHITFDVAGKDVTLKGEVSSEDERRHVESLLRLTPGIGTISNQLTVKQ
jgi:osmotically-inducible protein OsmY